MSDQKNPGYYYEHVNGTVHWKPQVVVESAGGPHVYFDSPMVVKWWQHVEGPSLEES